MKLNALHEANFLPKLDPKQAKKYGLNYDPAQHSKQFPQRSGSLAPPANPRHRKFMGRDDVQGTVTQNRGPQQSGGIHPEPNKAGQQSFEVMGQPYERGISNTKVGDDAELSDVDQNDPLGRGSSGKDGFSVGNGPAQDHGRQKSVSPTMRRGPRSFGKRYR
tara:strand:+ start:77636 stop:78121 length:486 start_codon:yes stop_codon:yes gene_type:complete